MKLLPLAEKKSVHSFGLYSRSSSLSSWQTAARRLSVSVPFGRQTFSGAAIASKLYYCLAGGSATGRLIGSGTAARTGANQSRKMSPVAQTSHYDFCNYYCIWSFRCLQHLHRQLHLVAASIV